MRSHLTKAFRQTFSKLPEHVKKVARKNYALWKSDPNHPGLEFKRVGKRQKVYSLRVGIGWRALGVLEADGMVWFWIGPHGEYDKYLKALK